MRFGIVAEFESPEQLVAAVHNFRGRGYRMMDAYTPYPIKELESALDLKRSRAARMVFPLSVTGAVVGFGLQWLLNGVLYPLNVGGRPHVAWFPFIIVTFETMVSFSVTGAFFLLMWLCRLPRLHHPLFEVEGFESATVDGFWLGINAADVRFDPDVTEPDLRALGAKRVEFVGESA